MIPNINSWDTYLFAIVLTSKIHHLTHQCSSTAHIYRITIAKVKIQILIHISLICFGVPNILILKINKLDSPLKSTKVGTFDDRRWLKTKIA